MMSDINLELYELWEKRIRELADELNLSGSEILTDLSVIGYFSECFGFATLLCENYRAMRKNEEVELTLEELEDYNARLYSGILPECYENSYVNPRVAVEKFGERLGRLLSFAAAELRAAIPSTFRGELDDLNIRLELMLELYSTFVSYAEAEEDVEESAIYDILYQYVYENYETQTKKKLTAQLIPGDSTWIELGLHNINNPRILYLSGEYVGENELKMFEYLNSLSSDTVQSMANTYTDGYIKGFEVTKRDITIKDRAEIRFNIGFIPMVKYACDNFEKNNLKVTMMRAGYSIFTGRSVYKNGFYGGNPNPQFDFDHKDDISLFLDENLNVRRLECLKASFEEYKTQARLYAGPAVIEIFGEKDFEPEVKKEASCHTDETRKLITEYAAKAGALTNDYIPGDERSFTIIAYPVPEIGEEFEKIFYDTILINTLDYEKYLKIQQNIIDTLDLAEYVYIEGMGENKTELYVHLHEITNPDKQTNFENCVADVNIPVGEVFTSPVLTGTKGTLHVCKVFLNGLEYKNLTLNIADGMITDYSCEKGKKIIEDNILFHHKTLPMGECAIGTNTTAFQVARKYGIEAKLPILIAEKTGPHFAFGDTCYSHSEDLAAYNPDGKEIIARDNECSLLRKTEPEKAYFNCHTDITIPYDELGEVSAVKKDGSRIEIIKNGYFVLPGCEELNIPLKKVFS